MDVSERDNPSHDKAVANLLAAALDSVKLVAEKRKAYGNSFVKVQHVIALLYPEGIPTAAYCDALAIVRVLDKLVRLATAAGQPDPMAESPWSDILGYALLRVAEQESSSGGE